MSFLHEFDCFTKKILTRNSIPATGTIYPNETHIFLSYGYYLHDILSPDNEMKIFHFARNEISSCKYLLSRTQ